MYPLPQRRKQAKRPVALVSFIVSMALKQSNTELTLPETLFVKMQPIEVIQPDIKQFLIIQSTSILPAHQF